MLNPGDEPAVSSCSHRAGRDGAARSGAAPKQPRRGSRQWEMGPRLRTACALALAGAACMLPACGQSHPSEGLVSNIDKARAAQTLSTLTQGLIAVQTVAAESGPAAAPALAAALQQRDASNRYTTAPPTDGASSR